ncbi:MAG: hypothetical protein OXG41_07220 [Acidimicrobiaceae bacterium]|nr:hypothetical protein [Acidimicrobiaceae bacterium]
MGGPWRYQGSSEPASAGASPWDSSPVAMTGSKPEGSEDGTGSKPAESAPGVSVLLPFESRWMSIDTSSPNPPAQASRSSPAMMLTM